ARAAQAAPRHPPRRADGCTPTSGRHSGFRSGASAAGRQHRHGGAGHGQLRLVAPRDGWPNEKARIAASGANFIIDGAEAYPAFEPALAGLNWVAATT